MDRFYSENCSTFADFCSPNWPQSVIISTGKTQQVHTAAFRNKFPNTWSKEHALIIRMCSNKQDSTLVVHLILQTSPRKLTSRRLVMQNETMKPSRWFTWEFFIYYGIVAGVTIATVLECIKISSPTHPSYSQYATLLSPGWLFNRQIDLSDHQFRSFRDGIPSLLALFTLFAAFNSRFGNVSRLVGTVIFLFLMHGFRAIEPVSLVAINYAIVKFIILKCSQKHHKWIVPFTWIYAILALCVLECKFPQWTWSGFLPRWNVVFKMSILRMISFNLDFKSHTTDNTFAFTFVSFFMYIFYPPLYLSGPILTFKDFLHQITLKHHHPKH